MLETAVFFFLLLGSFDWFDLHSWSRGLAPNPEGKDEESTSATRPLA